MEDFEFRIESWFLQHEKAVTNFLIYYMGHRDVEDLVQDTFIRALNSMDQYKGEASPKTWLLRIARNTAIDSLRKKNVLERILLKLHLSPQEPAPLIEDLLIHKEVSAKLFQAIHLLPASYREVVLLRGIADLSSVESAMVLGWSTNKVNVTFFRAIQKLKKKLGGDVIEEQ